MSQRSIKTWLLFWFHILARTGMLIGMTVLLPLLVWIPWPIGVWLFWRWLYRRVSPLWLVGFGTAWGVIISALVGWSLAGGVGLLFVFWEWQKALEKIRSARIRWFLLLLSGLVWIFIWQQWGASRTVGWLLLDVLLVMIEATRASFFSRSIVIAREGRKT